MLSPSEIAKYYVSAGAAKARLPAHKKIILGMLSGIFLALAGVGSTLGGLSVDAPSISKLIAALIFPTGLALILITGCELFTSNTLMVVSVLQREIKLSAMLSSWLVVYLANMIGSMLIAAAVVYGNTFDLFDGGLAPATMKIAASKTSLSFGVAAVSGIMCNILVCGAVWMTFAAKTVSGKIIGLFLPIMVFVLSGYEHCVANMYYIPAAIFAAGIPDYLSMATVDVSGITWGAFFIKNLLPVTLGNIIGGSVVIGMSQWAVHLRTSEKLTRS